MSNEPTIQNAPACPHCGVHPLRFNMNQGPVPTGQSDGTQLLVAQMWCNSCGKLVNLQIMGLLAPEQAGGGAAADPSADLAGKKPSLWKPS